MCTRAPVGDGVGARAMGCKWGGQWAATHIAGRSVGIEERETRRARSVENRVPRATGAGARAAAAASAAELVEARLLLRAREARHELREALVVGRGGRGGAGT